jgi:dCTP deaminase
VTILSAQSLRKRHKEFIKLPPSWQHDKPLINPASIDIRIGGQILVAHRQRWWRKVLCVLTLGFMFHPRRGFRIVNVKEKPFYMRKGDFVLAETLEDLRVPTNMAMDIRLKSSRAREGYNHLLAFWFDPGWRGIGTLELYSLVDWPLPIGRGMKIGQIIYHELDEECDTPYTGRYQGASSVETSKPDAEGRDYVR